MAIEIKKSNASEPLISIVIATFNSEEHIENCLNSIMAHSGINLEIIVIDGKSTDRTLDIIRAMGIPNLTLVSEKDKGIYDALNKGVRLAKGQYLYFLGSDDRLLDGFSLLANELGAHNTVYYGNSAPLDKLLSGKFTKYRLSKYCMNHQSIIYPAGVFKKYEYDLRYKVLADYALNIKVWGDKSFQKRYFPYTIAHYNMDGFSSRNKDVSFLEDRKKLIRKHLGLLTYMRYLFKEFKTRRRPEILEI